MYKMIIIDDETLTLRLFSKMVKNIADGFELVASFECAEDAIEYLKTDRVDVIISDISMPGMNGLEFLKYVEINHSNAIFIVLSAYKNFDYVKSAFRHNAFEYLTKPINRDELRELFARVKSDLDKKNMDVECNYSELKCQQGLIDYLMKNTDEETFSNIMKENNIHISCAKTPVAIVHTSTRNIAYLLEHFNYGSDRLHTALIQILRMTDIPALSVNYSHSGMNMLVFAENDNFDAFSASLNSILSRFTSTCTQLLSIEIDASVTGVYKSLDDAGRSISKILNLSSTIVSSEIKNEHINSVLSFIHANYQKDLSLSDVANYVHLTPFHLSKLFKNITGLSFVAYVSDYRLSKAKDMLVNSDMTVAEISVKSGFNNATTFYRTFKKFTGMSPQEYKNSAGME